MDDDMRGGTGAIYDYGFRVYDSRIGKFLSVDPLTKEYPWYTPYQFAGNMPIWAIDLDGLEENIVIFSATKTAYLKPLLEKYNEGNATENDIKAINATLNFWSKSDFRDKWMAGQLEKHKIKGFKGKVVSRADIKDRAKGIIITGTKWTNGGPDDENGKLEQFVLYENVNDLDVSLIVRKRTTGGFAQTNYDLAYEAYYDDDFWEEAGVQALKILQSQPNVNNSKTDLIDLQDGIRDGRKDRKKGNRKYHSHKNAKKFPENYYELPNIDIRKRDSEGAVKDDNKEGTGM